MSDVLSQNEKYTILSSEHGDSITLFWHQYMDKEGIQSWFFLQESWHFGKRIAIERSYPAGSAVRPSKAPSPPQKTLPASNSALTITMSVDPKGVRTPLSSIKLAQGHTSGNKVVQDEV